MALFSSPYPTIEEVLPWVIAYWDMAEHGTGGNLHVTLDDGNIDAYFFACAIVRSMEEGDYAAAWIAGAVIKMPWPRREKLYRAIGDVVYSAVYQNFRHRMVWPQKWHYGQPNTIEVE